MDLLNVIIGLAIGLIVGIAGAVVFAKRASKRKADSYLEEAKAEAEVVKKDKILQADYYI